MELAVLNGGRAKLPCAPAASCGCDESPPSFGLIEYYRARGMGHVGHPCGCTDRPASMSMETLGGPLAVAMTIPALRSWTRPWERFGGATGSTPVADPQRRRTSWDPFGKGVGTGTSPPPTRLASTGAGNGNPLLPSRSVGATPFTRRQGRSSGSSGLTRPDAPRVRQHRSPIMVMFTPPVDIYLSAGPVTATTSNPNYRSCDLDNVGNCRIFRVGWDFTTMTAVDAEEILAPNASSDFDEGPCEHGLGRIQPAISPDRTQLAWAAACHETKTKVRYQRIAVQAVGGGDVTYVSSTGGRRLFPEWRDDDTLLFGTDFRGGTVWSTDPPGPVVTGLAGPDMAGGTGDYKNPRVHRGPEYKTAGGDGPRMATFGLRNTTGLVQPLVSKLDGTAHEEFYMGTDPDFEECHHPAWNPNGTAIVCQREAKPTNPFGPFQEKGLYRFEWSSGSARWENMDQLFPSLDESVLEGRMGTDPNGKPLFPASTSGTPFCWTRAWKSPQWCHSDNFVIVTLTCSHPSIEFGFGMFTSRVVLVDMRDPDAPVVYDVTRELERHLGVDEGSYHAIFATCGTPE